MRALRITEILDQINECCLPFVLLSLWKILVIPSRAQKNNLKVVENNKKKNIDIIVAGMCYTC